MSCFFLVYWKIINFISVILLASLASMTVFTSAAKNTTKEHILKKLEDLENSIKENFECNKFTNSLSLINENRLLILFCTATLLHLICFLLNAVIFTPELVWYNLQYQVFTITIYVQCFQIFIFSKMVQNELQVLSTVELNASTPENLVNFKTCLIWVHEIVGDISDCFNLPMFFVALWIFYSVLSNAYFLGAYFFGIPNSSLAGKKNFQV